ncbi:MAG: zinc-ribbon domain-containing protein [Eubacterium sp.]|nr:zinc-ribbon domain-containing protein [Eubacterium sp.]
MRCPYCGEDNPDDARRCSRCGRRLDKVRVRKREKQLLVTGVVLVAVILAAGIGAMFGISKLLKNTEKDEPQKVTIHATPTPTEAVAAASSSESSSASVEVVASSSTFSSSENDAVTASIVDEDRESQIDLLGYSQVTVSNATATSTISQDGIDNTPHVLYDGSKDSSWQDGVDGDGIGESITYQLDQVYKVRFLVLRLGNWYNTDDNYTMNNRPKTMTFEIGDQSVQVTFPDEKKEFCVELSRDVKASEIKMIIDAVYKGTAYDDTCINEVDVYGVPTGETASYSDASASTDTSTAAGTAQTGTASGTTSGTTGSGTTGTNTTDGTTGTGTDTYGTQSTYGYTDNSGYADNSGYSDQYSSTGNTGYSDNTGE